jgi:hypothetical protein
MAQKIPAFVAKSFDPEDEAKIDPIEKFLESFTKLGFIARSAEQGEVESVSQKVRSLIDESEVFVGIFTKRHPAYRFQGRWATAMAALKGSLSPSTWSAPPWVLQESGYALKGNKDLILFRETDVEIPKLQGDLEYIPYEPRNPAPALQRASEMISGLIAKTGNIKIETIVKSQPTETKEREAIAPPKPSVDETKQYEGGTGEESVTALIYGIFDAVHARNWERAQERYETGLKRIREREPDQEMFWKSFYQWARFSEGVPEALGELRDLAAKNEGDDRPLKYLAMCLVELHEYEEAVQCLLRAASIAKPNRRASLEIDAAETLQKAKKPNQAKEILLRLCGADYANDAKTQYRILRQLYSSYKDSGDRFAGFAIAESALHKAPEEMSFRFSLAFDYGEADQNHMSLYHYKIICDQDEKNAGALNNLGIALANSDLPVLAVQRYKESYKLGETLAGSNLGRQYLDAGLSEEAIALLKEAQTKENCVPEVAGTLAAAHEKMQQNNREQEKVVAQAEQHRDFLLSFAIGYLSPLATNLQGRWSFPSGELELQLNGAQLSGSREDRTPVHSPLSSLFGTAPKSITRIEKLQFSGTVSGRTCKFKLETERREDPPGWSILGSPSDSKIEGFILFAEDGHSANVAELKAGKPEKYYQISKTK